MTQAVERLEPKKSKLKWKLHVLLCVDGPAGKLLTISASVGKRLVRETESN